MLHPILESLFFLKVARESVCNSINVSEIEDKDGLMNYVQNEASDFEIMHLITLGEMPEEKFNVQQEQEVWDIFRQTIVMNTESLKEDVDPSDIMNIVYEMGPVAHLGYSSAAPILEFDRANGRLEIGFLNERIDKTGETAKDKVRNAYYDGKEVGRQTAKKIKKAVVDTYTTTKPSSGTGSVSDEATGGKKSLDVGKIGAHAGTAAVGAAGLYGLYKMYKSWKAKKAAAKTADEKAVADKAIAKYKAKIASKKKA